MILKYLYRGPLTYKPRSARGIKFKLNYIQTKPPQAKTAVTITTSNSNHEELNRQDLHYTHHPDMTYKVDWALKNSN